MEWKLDRSRPLCPQIVEHLSASIASGELAPGERFASVRDIALAVGVNPNTVQKSFEELERLGSVYSIRGSGWYVSDNTDISKKIFLNMLKEKISVFYEDMARLGISEEDVRKYMEEFKHE